MKRTMEKILESGLYIIATPIGNLGDITLRALDHLQAVDKIACEDTRVTRKLLSRYSIKASLATYHDHNAKRIRPRIIKEIEGGKSVALVSDAGMPAISDPGYKLIRGCIESNLKVEILPGPSASLSALVVSGLPTDRFFFQGYLPAKLIQRKKKLLELVDIKATLIFHESPERIINVLKDTLVIFGNRPAAITRELTKMHENVIRGSLQQLLIDLTSLGQQKGELVLLVGGAPEANKFSDTELEKMLINFFRTMTKKDAIRKVATITGQSRKKIYQIAIKK